MTKKTIYTILLFTLTINNSFCQDFLFGKKSLRIIHAKHVDSLIYIEKIEKFKGSYFADFDTLKLAKGQFKGSHYKIKIKADQLCFFPGNIFLVKQYPTDSLFRFRNKAFINSYGSLITKQTGWADINPWTILNPLGHDSILTSINPDSSYKIIDNEVKFSLDTLTCKPLAKN